MNTFKSDKVLEFARLAHAGQVRKFTGVPYIEHPIAVARIAIVVAERKFGGFITDDLREIIRSIAYLHDTDEDTDATLDQISNLLRQYFSSNDAAIIVNAVAALTKPETNYDLFKYLDGIKQNMFAQIVKIADNYHNTSDLKDKKMLEKYLLIRYYLEN